MRTRLRASALSGTTRRVLGRPSCYVFARPIHINATPSTTSPDPATINIPDPATTRAEGVPDAQFEVLGGPFSLLSASVTASQTLYTRRGTLVAFNGKPEGAVSTLSLLEPFRRAITGIPFLYQKISATSPFTALIATKAQSTAFSVLHLDGRFDWIIAQRNALLAWTGHTLSLKPQINTSMSLAHWGNTKITGRGLVALAGKGAVYQVILQTGEEYVVHPSNIVAYSVMPTAPQPYRFKSSASLRLQVPSVSSLFPNTRFFQTMRETNTFRFLSGLAFTIRTWTRRSIFGDRLFLRFEGPANILIQARGNSITESLTNRDVNEIADVPAGAIQEAKRISTTPAVSEPSSAQPAQTTKVSFASVSRDGKVHFEKSS